MINSNSKSRVRVKFKDSRSVMISDEIMNDQIKDQRKFKIQSFKFKLKFHADSDSCWWTGGIQRPLPGPGPWLRVPTECRSATTVDDARAAPLIFSAGFKSATALCETGALECMVP